MSYVRPTNALQMSYTRPANFQHMSYAYPINVLQTHYISPTDSFINISYTYHTARQSISVHESCSVPLIVALRLFTPNI